MQVGIVGLAQRESKPGRLQAVVKSIQ